MSHADRTPLPDAAYPAPPGSLPELFVEVIEAPAERRAGGKALRKKRRSAAGTRPFSEAERRDVAAPPAEVRDVNLDQYHFLHCLERNPLGEVWKVRGPDGRIQLGQFLPALEEPVKEQTLLRLRALTDPGLVPFEIIRCPSGQTILVSELCERSLRDRFQDGWARGKPGIPRAELLRYLRAAAETLDALYLRHRLRHLALSPRNLLFQGDRLLVGGFGLTELFWVAAGEPAYLLNPRYAAPELFVGRSSRQSDQYSLALVYAELRTGVHPLRNPEERKPTRAGRTAALDLSLLSSAEREVVARGLDPDPAKRFPRATALVAALEEATARREAQAEGPPDPLGSLIALPGPGAFPGAAPPAASSLDHFVSELVLLATGRYEVKEFNRIRYTLEPGEMLLEHRCGVRMYPGTAVLKLEGFRQEWGARPLHLDEGLVVFSVGLAPTFWQRLIGRDVGLQIHVRLVPAGDPVAQRCEVAVSIRPYGCGRRQALQMLRERGPQVLESIRAYLQAHPEQRTRERLSCDQPLRVSPVFGGVQLADAIECRAKDISEGGIGFFLPRPLPTPEVYVTLPNIPEVAAYAGLARIVRKQPHKDGWIEVGAAFALDDRRRPRRK